MCVCVCVCVCVRAGVRVYAIMLLLTCLNYNCNLLKQVFFSVFNFVHSHATLTVFSKANFLLRTNKVCYFWMPHGQYFHTLNHYHFSSQYKCPFVNKGNALDLLSSPRRLRVCADDFIILLGCSS